MSFAGLVWTNLFQRRNCKKQTYLRNFAKVNAKPNIPQYIPHSTVVLNRMLQKLFKLGSRNPLSTTTNTNTNIEGPTTTTTQSSTLSKTERDCLVIEYLYRVHTHTNNNDDDNHDNKHDHDHDHVNEKEKENENENEDQYPTNMIPKDLSLLIASFLAHRGGMLYITSSKPQTSSLSSSSSASSASSSMQKIKWCESIHFGVLKVCFGDKNSLCLTDDGRVIRAGDLRSEEHEFITFG